MESVAFYFLNNPVGRYYTTIFQDDKVKAQIEGGSMKNHFHIWIGTSESRP